MPATSDFEIRGGYNPFQLKRNVRLDVLGQALNKLDAANEKALQQRSAIEAALADVKLNAAEDEWKQNYVNDIKKQIDAEAQFGNYAKALSTATRLAGEAVSNPALRGRLRANEQYEKQLAEIKSDRTLDDLTKQRWIDVNPYKYEDIRNSRGEIVGGTEWKANFNPVADVDIAQLRALAAQMTAEESGGSKSSSTRQTLLDASGNVVTDFGSASDIKMTTSGGSSSQYARKSKEKMTRVWNSLKSDSKILQGLNQKYETLRWAYENAQKNANNINLSPEERARYQREVDSYKSQIADKDGIIYSDAETWAQANIIPGFADMEYNNRHTGSDSSVLFNEGWFARNAGRAAQAANNADATVTEDVGTTGPKMSVGFTWNPSYSNTSSFDILMTK